MQPISAFLFGVPYYLGYGLTHPIALEGALKLKEITYAHCEGVFSSESSTARWLPSATATPSSFSPPPATKP